MALPSLPAREPAVTIAAVTAVIVAVLGLAVSFGLDLTADQEKAILGVLGGLGVLVSGLLTRTQVTPAADVVARVDPDSHVGTIVAGPASTVPTGQPVTVLPVAA